MNYAERRDTWERCWSWTGGIPQYFAQDEYAKFVALRERVYAKHLASMTEVSEFGCGTGHNLETLRSTSRKVRGFDWSLAAVQRTRDRGFDAEVFDMLHPDMRVKVQGAVLTIHSLEQLGADWQPFLDYLRSNKPLLCVHIEPIEELYDPKDEHDAACLAYHRKRGYLVGYLTRLRELERLGEAEIIEVTKSPFGGMNHDAYSVLAWRPL